MAKFQKLNGKVKNIVLVDIAKFLLKRDVPICIPTNNVILSVFHSLLNSVTIFNFYQSDR